MTVFIDTSSLVKRYIFEKDSSTLSQMFQEFTSVIVAPVAIIEIHSGLNRRLADKTLSLDNYQILGKIISRDFDDFSVVHWNDDLVTGSLRMVQRYQLRALDAIQLASAICSRAPQMITSDKQLYQAAKKEIKKVVLL